ncbi:SigE family RNA polymerase sigma factor [Myceligenerans pegani]|uniref:SigE family RNA polymerase sigma factor n=1 Tax=Myceligenerans pegani TaxID=2776917 RepID=A0ABR9MV93_9MICO|nr:SigE family RNA polymerase sigma factor [Myceligenerans sp. TRM 65318]MBE1874778.1 SigE family RNA polymerase sigma factor [Myceligenerans sp. TRM 65318]MBE3017049.1 SigE family RNA polymerase sigma factor [Myceligenerans sp. TRM 65318]
MTSATSADAITGSLPVVVAGDRTREVAFTAFAQARTPDLVRMAYFLCGDAHRAHDLAQTALERTFRHWNKLADGDPYAYARRVVATARIDTWRRNRKEIPTEDDAMVWRTAEATEASDTAIAERDRLVRALAKLTAKQRRVVVLRYLLDRSEAETAETLGVSAGTVKSTASRALALLRAELGADGFGTSREEGR